MKPLAAAAVSVILAAPAAAQPAAPVSRVISTTETTLSGQPIALPQGKVAATFTEVTIPPGGRLPAHKHPYPRFAWVVSGELKVVNLDTGGVTVVRGGQLAVDSVDQWHEAEVVGAEPVRMMVLDEAPPGVANTVRREP